jgi:gluconate 2-dehydrogenase gamma chain
VVDQFLEMDRRQWLANAFLLVGATATASCDFSSISLGKAKGVLDADQMKLLSAVADVIMPATDTPGAVAVGIPAKLDAILADWASAENRKLIVESLGRINAGTQAAHMKDFAALSAAERNGALRLHEIAALKKVPPPPNAPKGSIFSPAISVGDNGYVKLKELIVSLYYSSEVAMTKELIYEHVPGEWQPSIKATDKTRPWASVGPF